MTLRPKVSVIVPMYNVEAFVGQCIESIRCQTLDAIEIILVDDGSPDNSGRIADDFAQLDKRIKVVHRENGGLGPARNTGIDAATGEYVGFVDSDDWIESDMYESLYRAASVHSADIAFSGLKSVAHGRTVEHREQPLAGRVLRGQSEIYQVRAACYGAPPCKDRDDPTPVSVCTGIYRLEFLNERKLRFRNIRSEDKFFNTEAGRAASIIACIGGSPYCYRKDDQPSITKSFKQGTIDSFYELFDLLKSIAEEEPVEFREDARSRASRCVIDYCRVLIGMVEESSSSEFEKRGYVQHICSCPDLANSCKGYPFWKLPAQQAVFYLCLRYRLVHLLRLLVKARKRI